MKRTTDCALTITHTRQSCVEDAMARSILRVCLLLTVMHVTDGQSTSADRRCVYMFNVPESNCDQTPGPSVDDQLLKSHVIALQAQLKLMASDMRVMQEHIEKLDSDNKQLVNDVDNLKKERPNSNTGT